MKEFPLAKSETIGAKKSNNDDNLLNTSNLKIRWVHNIKKQKITIKNKTKDVYWKRKERGRKILMAFIVLFLWFICKV